jgi:sulfur-oxidizing protein SoxY
MRGTSGEPLAQLELFEPVGEDPTMTLLLRLPASDIGLDIEGRDNNGGVYRSTLPAPWRQSAVEPGSKARTSAKC